MAVIPTAWNPADKDATVTLSGGDLIADSAYGSVRSTASVISGKYYWELTFPSGITQQSVGVGTSSADISYYPGFDSKSWALNLSSRNIESNGSVVGSLSAAFGALLAGLPAWLAAAQQVDPLATMRAMFVLYGAVGLGVWALYRGLPAEAGHAGHAGQVQSAPLGASRPVVLRLALLFSVDAFAGGLVVNALLALWLAGQPEADALAIAAHWQAADEPQTTLAWQHRGAEQLKARGRFDDARAQWRTVADASLDAAQALRARLELAACDLFDDLARGQTALDAVLAQLGAVADGAQRRHIEGRALAALVDNRVFAGDIPRASEHAERLRQLERDRAASRGTKRASAKPLARAPVTRPGGGT